MITLAPGEKEIRAAHAEARAQDIRDESMARLARGAYAHMERANLAEVKAARLERQVELLRDDSPLAAFLSDTPGRWHFVLGAAFMLLVMLGWGAVL